MKLFKKIYLFLMMLTVMVVYSTMAVSQAKIATMCQINTGFDVLSFCYDLDETSGTTVHDASAAGNPGTFSSTGITYGSSSLVWNGTSSITTDGSTGSISSGFIPTNNTSWSLSFYVDLLANAANFGRIASTGDPKNNHTGFYILQSTGTPNHIYATIATPGTSTQMGDINVALNTPTHILLTYNAATNIATLCANSQSPPTCETSTLPGAYMPSGNAVVFGGGSVYAPVNAIFDEIAFWDGTVRTTSQLATSLTYLGLVAPATSAPTTPPPTPSPSPSPTSTPSPTPSPAASPSGCPANLDPGIPCMPHSYFYKHVPTSPTIASNNAAIIQYYAQNEFQQTYDNTCFPGFCYQFGATNGTSAPDYATRAAIFHASNSDPVYTINDQQQYGERALTGTVHIPAAAIPQGGFGCQDEHHIAIEDPTGTYVDVYIGTSSIGNSGQLSGCGTQSSSTVVILNGARFILATSDGACSSSSTTAQGCAGGGSITASAMTTTEGLVSAYELMNGPIQHGFRYDFSCTNGTNATPALGSDSPCPTTTNAAAEGQNFYFAACATWPLCTPAQSTATINSWSIPTATKTILIAMATYCNMPTDTTGGNSEAYIETIDPHSYVTGGVTNYWPAFQTANSMASYPIGLGNYGYDFQFRNIPTNPNSPTGAVGWWSWVAFLSPTAGC